MYAVTRITAVASLALLAGTGAARRAPGPSGSFVIRKGNDTVAVERFTREGGVLSGEIIQPAAGIKTQYVILLRPDGTVDHVDCTRTGRQGNSTSIGLDFGDRSVDATISAAGQSERESVVLERRAHPFLAVSFAITEQLVQASHLATGQTVKWTVVRLGVGDTATATVKRFHADSVSITMADVGIKAAIDAKGEVVGGSHATQPWIVERAR